MEIVTFSKRRTAEPSDMRATHILHKLYYIDGQEVRVTIERYPDGTFKIRSLLNLSDEDIFSIDWGINVFGYVLTYPDGVTTGAWMDTPRDKSEICPFTHLFLNGHNPVSEGA